MIELKAAAEPVLYFIGVTTGQSSIMKIFPKWASYLGINACIKGIDVKPHAPAEDYREIASFIKKDPLSAGALITSHKLDLFTACRDLFDYTDPYAEKLGEVSSLSKNNGLFCAHAKDPISGGMALEDLVPRFFWAGHNGEVLLLGAGGSSLALSLYLMRKTAEEDRPGRITITNRSEERLVSAKAALSQCNNTEIRFRHCPCPADNDRQIAALPPYSLIINATGLGKDAPGSPATDAVSFPEHSLVWEINYRGDLLFMRQALAQKEEKKLIIENGWNYFIYGWTQVIQEVFHITIDAKQLNELSRIAHE